MLVCSCAEENDLIYPDQLENNTNNAIGQRQRNGNNGGVQPDYFNHELIIQYKNNVLPHEKARLRDEYGVIAYEVCPFCPTDEIEKWVFRSNVQIEPIKKVIGGDDETNNDEGKSLVLNVGYNFNLQSISNNLGISPVSDMDFASHVKGSNSGVTIAILDTGFDPDFSLFNDITNTPLPLLYNPGAEALPGEVSGWNFVDNNPIPYDDDLGKHGTAIGNIIRTTLEDFSIPFQLLPLKVANAAGKVEYFDLLCATNLALERADVLQVSLGWYDNVHTAAEYENTILFNLIATHPNVFVVTSAGNKKDNNNDTDPHYPSSFDLPNVIAVASTNAAVDNIANFSCYGPTSVDFFAVGAGLPFYNRAGTPLTQLLNGTSFAAPQVAAMVAKHLHTLGNISPTTMLNTLDSEGTPATSYDYDVKYNKIIMY